MAKWSERWSLTEMQKKWKKAPLSHQKIKCLFLDYVQLLMTSRAIWVTNVDWNTKNKTKKGPLCHWKIKCSVLDYIQLLMISHAIQATKVNWNMEKGPLSDWKMKYSLLYYIQLLMIGQAIQVMKVYQNVKKWHVSVMVFCCFSLGLLYAFPPPPGWQGRN